MKRLIEFRKESGQQNEMNGLVFNGGSGGHTHDQHGIQAGKDTAAIYRCPMKCEGDKTYSEPGRCPVCGMFLTPADGGSHKH